MIRKVVRGSLDAVVEDEVGDPGLLLDLFGARRSFRRDRARLDDQVGAHPRDHLDGLRRVRPHCAADDRQPGEFCRDIGSLPAGQRSAPAQKLLRSQHKDEDVCRRVRRHDPPDAIGHHHVTLGRIDKPGRSARPGEERQE